MNSPLRLERPQTLTDLAFLRIREAIVNGDLKLGEQVSEVQLAQGMGISKTPVREALVRLKVEGLVDIHPQRGTFVFKLEPEQVGQLCRFRAMVETAALRETMAVQQETLAHEMARCVAEMAVAEAARDVKQLARIDMDFHWQFFAFCPNSYLRGAYDLIRYQLIALRHRAPIANAVDSHQVLVDAVERRDVDGAVALLRAHALDNEARYRVACGVA